MPFTSPPFGDGTAPLWLRKLSPHDKPWDKHRASADIVSKLYQQDGYDRYSERIRECSEWLQFALGSGERGEMSLKLFSARFCRVRLCPVCQWRKSLMWRARFLKAMPQVIAAHPKSKYVFLTLTIKNCPVTELRETIKFLNNSWQKLVKRKEFPAIGFVRALEITRNPKTGEAHPHFHCLLMVKPSYFSTGYLTKVEWAELWQSCLGVDYPVSVDIKVVKPKKKLKAETSDGLIQAICETLKYSVKESDLVANADWLGELTKQLHNVRSVTVGGIFKDFLKEDDPEDLIHGDDEPDESLEDAPKLIFDWSTIIKRYAKRLD